MERTSPGLSLGPGASLNVGAKENLREQKCSPSSWQPGQKRQGVWGGGGRLEGKGGEMWA